MYDTLEKHLHIDKIENIMIDKDLQNIDFLKEFFPKANILLCTFHVIKYLKVVTGKYESEENKQVIMDIIEDMVYADYVEEYQELLT
jgi:transposase